MRKCYMELWILIKMSQESKRKSSKKKETKGIIMVQSKI